MGKAKATKTRWKVSDADTTAVIATRKGRRKKWPSFSSSGTRFVVTAPARFGEPVRPREEFSYFGITHQPTGFLATEVVGLDKARKVATILSVLFGDSVTVCGVMRKWGNLPKSVKDWIRDWRHEA